MQTTSKPKIVCQCGCDTETTMNKCAFVRRTWRRMQDGVERPGLVTWVILKEHREAFENELGLIHAVDQVTRANLGRSWLRRLAVAAQLYDLQCDIYRRTKGDREARRQGWRSVRLFLVPQWPWLIKRLTRSQNDVRTKEPNEENKVPAV